MSGHTETDESGDARSTTQRTLDMLRDEWHKEERRRIVDHVAREIHRHDGTKRIDAADEAYGQGYVQALDDILEWLSVTA